MDSVHTPILEHLVVDELSKAIPHFHYQLEKITLHISRLNSPVLPGAFERATLSSTDFTRSKEGILELGSEKRLLDACFEDILL